MNLLSEHGEGLLKNAFSLLGKTYGVSDLANGFRPKGDIFTNVITNGFALLSKDISDDLSDRSLYTNINVVSVEDRDGVAFLESDSQPCTGTVNTDDKDRETADLFVSPSTYKVHETQTDIAVKYSRISSWAVASKSKSNSDKMKLDFTKKYTNTIQKRIALDILNIGFNGVSTSGRNPNPLYLTGVNKGWTQVVKEQKAVQVNDTELTIGTAGDYANLDEIVTDMTSVHIREDLQMDLICIISSNLVAEERRQVYQTTDFTKEKKKTADTFLTFGGLERVVIPGFPDGQIVVTSLDNLSLYIKDNTIYRQIVLNAKRNRVEDYNQREDAFVVENLSKYAACTNVKYAELPVT